MNKLEGLSGQKKRPDQVETDQIAKETSMFTSKKREKSQREESPADQHQRGESLTRLLRNHNL